ncbi:High-osmolarity-induced transcription protein 1 [Purpureocillium lavendulum]|uniref:High-osmolarity-induced transcription protein 1 n=1 Tax=Purpureocillium lavendulum TaxID=1247861 RepID=A0AB34FBJ2_9HYPO|nr:High-osmolarity-induced transcription protein 1 [Purpureocillium lavendulum]
MSVQHQTDGRNRTMSREELDLRGELALHREVHGDKHPDTLACIDKLAAVLVTGGKYEAAVALCQDTFDKKHPDTLNCITNLAALLAALGMYEKAEAVHRKALKLCEDVFGKRHPDTLICMNDLAVVLVTLGMYENALATHDKALALCRDVFGDNNPITFTSRNNYAVVLAKQGKYDDAEKTHREVLSLRQEVLGDKHPSTLTSRCNLAQVLLCQGKYAEAEEMHRETLALDRKIHGDRHPDTLTSGNNLAVVLVYQGKYKEAEELHRETWELRLNVLGDRHPETLTSQANHALALACQGKYEESDAILRHTLALRQEVLGTKHPDTVANTHSHAQVVLNKGMYKEAEIKYLEALALCKDVFGNHHPNTLTTMDGLAVALTRQGKYKKAETLHVETSQIAEELADLLVGNTPFGLSKAYFVNSGSEAIDAAMKLAIQYHIGNGQPQRQHFVSRKQSYHGNTIGAMSISSNIGRKEPNGTSLQLSNVSFVELPCAYHGKRNEETAEEFTLRLVEDLDAEFQRVGPDTVAAFVAETVGGSTSGCVVSPPGYFEQVRALCDRYGILLILDEVMCGSGRTGTYFAFEAEGKANPDLVTLGKGLAGGYAPISAVLARGSLYDKMESSLGGFAHGHTYQAHPVTFGDLKYVGDIRGRGLFWALEFVQDKATKRPFARKEGFGVRVAKAAYSRGLALCSGTGTVDGRVGDHVLLGPPLTISEVQLEEMVLMLRQAYQDVEEDYDTACQNE